MVEPFFTTELETITAMNCGTICGGFELLPGRLVHVLPQVGEVLLFSKPLKALGPGPPVIGLFWDQCEPQKFRVAPPARLTKSPIAKAPPAGNWNGVHTSP